VLSIHTISDNSGGKSLEEHAELILGLNHFVKSFTSTFKKT
jgi:hypothetical protein